MIDWLEAVGLGLVQGATEYLPVSSSGHLVIAQHLFGLQEPALLFDIVLHLATLIVVVWFYRADIRQIVQETFAALPRLIRREPWRIVAIDLPGFRLAWLIIVGTIPTALIGITMQDRFEQMFASLRAVGWMLGVTGVILLLTRFAKDRNRGVAAMGWKDALVIGIVQGVAISPGISRSGSTIGTALLLGIERDTAARFSFLLSVPSIIGALLLKLGDGTGSIGAAETVLGFSAALFSGYLCLALLVRVVRQGRLAWFAPYCFVVGLLALVMSRGL